MKNARDVLDLRHKKSLRLGLLLLSSLFTISTSALVYSSLFYERELNVGDATEVTTGSGDVSFTPASIMMLAVVALVIGLSMLGFLREASKHIGKVHGGQESWPTGPGS